MTKERKKEGHNGGMDEEGKTFQQGIGIKNCKKQKYFLFLFAFDDVVAPCLSVLLVSH